MARSSHRRLDVKCGEQTAMAQVEARGMWLAFSVAEIPTYYVQQCVARMRAEILFVGRVILRNEKS